MKTLHKIDLPNEVFKEPFFYKDCSIEFLEKKLPANLIPYLREISTLLPDKKYITFDIGFLTLKAGDKTCKGVGWHVDGIGNDYLIYCKGDFRTQFMERKPDLNFPTSRSELKDFNNSIAFLESESKEIPDSTLVRYDSQDVHRGRTATSAGQRFFLRVCSSDYLYPKNAILKQGSSTWATHTITL